MLHVGFICFIMLHVGFICFNLFGDIIFLCHLDKILYKLNVLLYVLS